MSSEAAAYQAAQQRHKHNMAFGKKQRYIEVFQCSGEDMHHVLTPGSNAAASLLTAGSTSTSPVKTTTTNSNAAAAAAAVAAANGLLPSGMLTAGAASTATPQNTTFGLDPNWAAAAAAMQMQMQPSLAFLPNSAAHQAHYFPAANAMRFPAQAALYNPAMQQAVALQQIQQQQLLQQQLLQSQLAAQRLLLSSGNASTGAAAAGGPGLIGPRPPPKRSFDQAFTTPNSAASVETEAKRVSYGTPTISAAPTTYNSR